METKGIHRGMETSTDAEGRENTVFRGLQLQDGRSCHNSGQNSGQQGQHSEGHLTWGVRGSQARFVKHSSSRTLLQIDTLSRNSNISFTTTFLPTFFSLALMVSPETLKILREVLGNEALHLR